MTELLNRYELSPLIRLSCRHDALGSIVIAAGMGDDRSILEVNSAKLVTWLLEYATTLRTKEELRGDIAQRLALRNMHDAEVLLTALIDAGVLVEDSVAQQIYDQGTLWENAGWRDAFDFHAAVSGIRFDKLYDTDKYRKAMEGFLADPSFGPQPEMYKETREHPVIDLRSWRSEKPLEDGGESGDQLSLADCLLGNRPINFYENGAQIEASEVAGTLIEGFGTRRTADLLLGPHQFKTYPAGGARHPLELYLVARNVTGIPQGVYHFHPGRYELELIGGPEKLGLIDESGFLKKGIRTAPSVLYLTSRWIRHSWKYRYSRSYRMVLMEVGHAVQAVRIAGAAAGLDVYYSPAIDEPLICSILGIDDPWIESPLCALGLGKGGVI